MRGELRAAGVLAWTLREKRIQHRLHLRGIGPRVCSIGRIGIAVPQRGLARLRLGAPRTREGPA